MPLINKRWDGGQFRSGATFRRWTGSAWKSGATVRTWTGSDWVPGIRFKIEGGRKYEVGEYIYHAFDTVGEHTFTVTGIPGDIEWVIIGGGGSGDWNKGGGGGAGALNVLTAPNNYTINKGTYSVVVGDGGINIGGSQSIRNEQNGEDSMIRGISHSLAGGGGKATSGSSTYTYTGSAPGVAATARRRATAVPIRFGARTYVNDGGIRFNWSIKDAYGDIVFQGIQNGGGGGAGAAAKNMEAGAGLKPPGNWYKDLNVVLGAVCGGGAGYNTTDYTQFNSIGGIGGGGDSSGTNLNGTPGTGGGGGAFGYRNGAAYSRDSSGSGGSGAVYIRYIK